MARIVSVFPRRPIALAKDKPRRRRRALLLVAVLLSALPSLYWGNISWQRARLQQDLRLRGVQADEVIKADGNCTSRRNRYSGAERPVDCWLTLTYRLRPEEGGAVVTAPAHLDGRMPIFTPPAFYDPQAPERVMLKPEMDRDLGWDETFGPYFLLIIPAILLGLFFGTSRRGLAAAARAPQPIAVAIEKVGRAPNKYWVRFRAPGAAKSYVDTFKGTTPLTIQPPPGSPPGEEWALALVSPGGRPYLLDARLAGLDLTEEERAAVLAAAWA
jgi:hypothetical protein